MKLQIISRLTKNQLTTRETLKETFINNTLLSTQTNQKYEKLNQYYSINTENNFESIKQTQKNNLRDFFSFFNTKCDVKYKHSEPIIRDFRRKLQPVLQAIKSKQQKMKKNEEYSHFTLVSTQQNSQTLHIKSQIEQKQPQHLRLDPKQTYFYQKIQNKIRKVNSLISLDQQVTANNSIDQNRKPGFIRMNKSIAKKQSSLQISKITVSHKDSKQNSDRGNDNKNSQRSENKMDQQINESKQRIAKIRRQLNQIYLMRHKPTELKLKLS